MPPTSNGSAKADRNVAQKCRSKADKKLATQAAAAKVTDESSTSSDATSNSNSVDNSQDKTGKKQTQLTTQAAVEQTSGYRPKMGVYDGDHFVDAETYLVDRMKRVKKKLVWL